MPNSAASVRRNGVPTGYAVAVLIITPQGIPLIRDPKKPPPVFWKAPGGRSARGESAKEAAVREVKEEIGMSLSAGGLSVVREEDRGSHALVLFSAKLESLPDLKPRGDEGEEIKVFRPERILKMSDFFPNHRMAFEKILKTL